MKSIGIVRRIDELGRIVLPKELRRTHDIKNGDAMEIYVDGDVIMLKKYNPGCIICGACDAVRPFNGKTLCEACRKDMAKDVLE